MTASAPVPPGTENAGEECLSILHVSHAAPVGGLERVVQTLAIGQARRGHAVQVAGVGEAGKTAYFSAPLREAGVSVHTLDVTTLSVLSERRFVSELCRRYRPAIVHTHGYRPDIVDASVARRLGIPTVSTEHGTGWDGFRGWLYELLQLRSLRSFDAVVPVSRPIERLLERSGIESQRIHRILNAWSDDVEFATRGEARAQLGIPEDAYAVGWVGRFIPAKGCDLFIRCIAGLRDLPMTAVVIGGGPSREELEALASTQQVAGRLRFAGEIPGAAACLRAFDVLVMSSRSEGSPIVLLEAMAAGVPVVATTVGGLPDMVSSDEAFLVEGESPAALEGAVRSAHADPGAAHAKAERARARLVAEYGVEPWLDRYDHLYRRILDSRRSSD